MTQAYKCARCGKLYDEDKQDLVTLYNRLQRLDRRSYSICVNDPFSYDVIGLELCEDCQAIIEYVIEHSNEDVVEALTKLMDHQAGILAKTLKKRG